MLQKLYARRRFGIRPGLDRVQILLERLGHPEKSFRSIHIVGTNGKGSTAAFLSSILNSAGHRTALFTSPHLVNFNERLRINGLEITPERLAALLARVLSQAPDEATFFEIVTALGALYFAEEKSEIVVLEAGMGGKSDATAAIPGMMTVVTPIALDHSEYLGSTITEIAAEKAAIAEPGTPLVSAQQDAEVQSVIYKLAAAQKNPLYLAGEDFLATWNKDWTLAYQGMQAVISDLNPGIPGRYQAGNAALALAAAEVLGRSGLALSNNNLQEGISSACWPGRMEMIPGRPPLLLDGAHNPAGAAALAAGLESYQYRRLLLVAGTMSEKDVRGIFSPLASKVYRAYTVTPSVERAVEDHVLAAILNQQGINALPCGSVADGIKQAQNQAEDGDLILVCGSLFVVGETKAWLANRAFEGIRG
ncbi:MAG TPA: folylpolyglutamate synthase/dihydrofolate synthase family protein [Desulfuromonadaceae bacterium]